MRVRRGSVGVSPITGDAGEKTEVIKVQGGGCIAGNRDAKEARRPSLLAGSCVR
ncbi:hypothetical protein Hanom_Chr03g00218941 [Helianthus anomalus]